MRPSLLFVTLAGVLSVSATPTERFRRELEDYGVEVQQWEVQAFPEGPKLLLNGTVEEVHDQLLDINPNYDADFKREDGSASLDKRTDFSGSGYSCDSRTFIPTYTHHIRAGISYLRGVSGRPTSGPGPGNCSRVSCSWQSAIWWCNDAREVKTLVSFGSIADGAQYIVDRCDFRQEGLPHVAGQVFHSTSWNVIVRWDNVNCGRAGWGK